MPDVSHGVRATVVFVVTFSAAGEVLLLLSLPLGWAIPAMVGIAAIAVKMVRDVRGNRAT